MGSGDLRREEVRIGRQACRFGERYHGPFERRRPLEDVEEEKVSAVFKNGLLTANVPKSAEA